MFGDGLGEVGDGLGMVWGWLGFANFYVEIVESPGGQI